MRRPRGASDQNTLGIWASASRPKINILRNDGTHTGVGPWVQVSRIGLPLINEAVIGLQDKDKYNRTAPVTDVANFAAYFEDPVIVKDAEAVGIYAALGVSAATVTMEEGPGRTDILTIINLTNIPTVGAHAIPIAAGTTGDVLCEWILAWIPPSRTAAPFRVVPPPTPSRSTSPMSCFRYCWSAQPRGCPTTCLTTTPTSWRPSRISPSRGAASIKVTARFRDRKRPRSGTRRRWSVIPIAAVLF